MMYTLLSHSNYNITLNKCNFYLTQVNAIDLPPILKLKFKKLIFVINLYTIAYKFKQLV